VIVSCKIIFELIVSRILQQCHSMSLTTDKVDIQSACTADQAQRRAYISLDKLHTTIESRNVFSVSSVSNGIAGDDCFMLSTTNFKAVQKSNFKFNNITGVQKPQSSKIN